MEHQDVFVDAIICMYSNDNNQCRIISTGIATKSNGGLNYTLKLLENQNYPKHRIGLFIRSDHNEDHSEDILETWLESQMEEYYFKDVSLGKNFGERFQDQKLGPMEWSPSRFSHVITLKEEALNKARKLRVDWIWYLDADAFITNPSALRLIIILF